jgi:hypothetical protein
MPLWVENTNAPLHRSCPSAGSKLRIGVGDEEAVIKEALRGAQAEPGCIGSENNLFLGVLSLRYLERE